MDFIVIFILSILGGILYRMGGTDKGTKWRDFGVPLCIIFSLLMQKLFANQLNTTISLYIVMFGMTFGAMTTYWDWLTRLWRGDEDEYWENWVLHGLFIGLAAIPLLYAGMPLQLIVVRALILGVSMSILSVNTDDVFIEEFGRGFLAVASTAIFMVH